MSAAADDASSKLPGDLLGEVYARISSPLDRVRFAAVCRSWRLVASSQPPAPTFPWLILSSYDEGGTALRAYSPVDGALLRVPLPPQAIGKRLVGFHEGGWVAAASAVAGGGDSLAIVNLFSGVEVPLSAKQQRTTQTIKKIVFSEAPTSRRCILAAALPRYLSVCRVGFRRRRWLKHAWHLPQFHDMAFCHGKLYVLLVDRLCIFEFCMTRMGSPAITWTYMLSTRKVDNKISQEGSKISYIVKHNDKLLAAVRAGWSLEHEHVFKVYEPINIDSTGNERTWTEVTTLDDHALFLGDTCSKLAHVPTGGRGGIEGNHIYYSYICLKRNGDYIYDDLPWTKCNNGNHLCRMEDKKFSYPDGITSVGYNVPGNHHALTWLLPPDF